MAKARSNNSDKSENKKPITTSKYSIKDVYNEKGRTRMEDNFAGDVRGRAAAVKEDIHGANPVKRYPYGSQSYKEAEKQSAQNAEAARQRNQTTSNEPGNKAGTAAAIRGQDNKKLEQYSKTSADAQQARKNATQADAKKKVLFKAIK